VDVEDETAHARFLMTCVSSVLIYSHFLNWDC